MIIWVHNHSSLQLHIANCSGSTWAWSLPLLERDKWQLGVPPHSSGKHANICNLKQTSGMYHQNSICNSNHSVNLWTCLVSPISIWRCQVLEPAVDVDNWRSIYHICNMERFNSPDFQIFLQLPTIKNIHHNRASGCLPDCLTAELLKAFVPMTRSFVIELATAKLAAYINWKGSNPIGKIHYLLFVVVKLALRVNHKYVLTVMSRSNRLSVTLTWQWGHKTVSKLDRLTNPHRLSCLEALL